MPTSRSTSAERSATSSRDQSMCAWATSRNCAPIVVIGFSAFIALCITSEQSRQRSAFSCFWLIVTRFWPLNTMVPAVIAAGGLNNRAIANSSVDFPQPDSPTTPTNSPAATSRSTPSTATTGALSVAYSTVSPLTSSTAPAPSPDRPQRGVADLVERVVDQRERRAEQRDTEPGGDRPQRRPGLQRLLVLRPVQHRPPADRVRIT